MSGAPLVTGGGGFVGTHLVAHLRELGLDPVAPSRAEVDLLDAEAARAEVRRTRPRVVFHLAALASVARSWEGPEDALVQNMAMTLHVLDAVRAEAPDAKVLIASSSEVYGPPERLPVTEDAPLRPQSPYGVAKASCDLLGGQQADAHGLHVVRTRAFNHAGPGQAEEFVLGTLARQVAEAEAAGHAEALVRTGNPDARRDFTDVRDVVRAYALAVEQPPGVYNVCTGRAVSVARLVELLGEHARIPVRRELDPARVRAADVPEVYGSAERLRAATGWAPRIPLERTVADAMDAWRERLRAAR